MEGSVGVCGLGNMGAAIAGRLARAFEVVGYDPDPERAAAAGVRAAGDLDALAGEAEAIVLCLPAPAVSHEVVAALAAATGPGALVVEASTVTPDDVRRMGAACAGAEIALVDAAVLSGVAEMEAGRATLLVGGSDADVERARPVLDAFSDRVEHFGALGTGMAAKVVNNAIAHAVMVVLVEGAALARASGVSLAAIIDLLRGPDAGLTRPLTHRLAERVTQGDFEGGMPTDNALKDSALALEVAQDAGVPLFAVQAAHSVYELAAREGLGREDYAAIARLWERWLGRPLAGE